MTRLVFVQDLAYPHLGAMSLSSHLKRHGHHCDALIGDQPDELLPHLARERPDVIAFSVMTGTHRFALAAAPVFKKALPGSLVVMGGPHATFTPEVVRSEGIDAICRGEGEGALLELCDALAAGAPIDGIRNLWVKRRDGSVARNPLRPLIADLDTLPPPDRELYGRYPQVGRSRTQIFMASRGCPFDCSYCFNHQWRELYRGLGPPVRYRSVGGVIDEIRDTVARMPVHSVYLNDDTFILNRSWVVDFADAYRKAGLRQPFTCLIRADLADEDLVQRLAAAGCTRAFFGVETGSERLRTGLLRKQVTDEQIFRTSRWLHAAGIKFRTYNMLGLPGETLEDALATVRINQEIGADYPWAAIYMPYPGTELAEECRRQGLLPASFTPDEVSPTFHDHSALLLENRRELENLHHFFQTAVLFPRALPLIKRLIRLPPNRLFVLWFTLVYGFVFIRSENRGWWETLALGLKNLRHLAPALGRGREDSGKRN